jgi:hypothetical protein
MAWFRNHYRCEKCDVEWSDEWSCMCDDRCPECDAEITPSSSEELEGGEKLENPSLDITAQQ